MKTLGSILATVGLMIFYIWIKLADPKKTDPTNDLTRRLGIDITQEIRQNLGNQAKTKIRDYSWLPTSKEAGTILKTIQVSKLPSSKDGNLHLSGIILCPENTKTGKKFIFQISVFHLPDHNKILEFSKEYQALDN